MTLVAIGCTIDDRFVIQRKAGAGGMATVLQAQDRRTGQTVAVKLLDDTGAAATERFFREARIMAELEHPHIVKYLAHGRTEAEVPYIAMEWISGESLDERLRHTPLSIGETIAMGRRAAEAIGAAHARGMVHRDLKPSNVMLVDGDVERLKVIDFGVARLLEQATLLTQDGVIIGTPGYMAPEQARGEGEVGPAADVFSLGCILFECLSGEPPFTGKHLMAVLTKILFEDLPRLGEGRPFVPPPLCALVDRMLCKDPAARPSDGGEVARAIDAVARELDESGWVGAGEGPRATRRPAAISGSERRLLSIVAIAPESGVAATRGRFEVSAELGRAVRALSIGLDVQTELLADGTVIAMLVGAGHATDRAALAARYALRLRAAIEGARIVLVTALFEGAKRSSLGHVAEDAAALLSLAVAPDASAVVIDATTRAMLGACFEVLERDGVSFLVRERPFDEGSGRLLLGKPSPFVGRGRELASMRALCDECFEERRPSAVVVIGEAGMGKTRLRHEFVEQVKAAWPEAACALGRADSMSPGSPYGLLRASLRALLGLKSDATRGEERRRIQAEVARLFEEEKGRVVEVFLGELAGVSLPEDGSGRLHAARQDAKLMEREIEAAWVDLVGAMARTRPVLLVLEDLHWGDHSSVKAVEVMLSSSSDWPIVVAAFARPEVSQVFPRLWSGSVALEVRLAGLSRRAAEEITRAALGGAAEGATVATIVARAAGNAFYLEELIRAVAEGRGEELPATVQGMVEARLSALDGDARRRLRAASIFGETFWPGGVSFLLGDADEQGERDPFEALVEREIVVRRRERRFVGEEELAFRHALVREGAYAMLTERDRKSGHVRAAQWLVHRGASSEDGKGPGKPEHHAVVARHFAQGEAWDEAATHHELAGAGSARWNAALAARRHYDEALSALREIEDAPAMRRRRVDVTLERVRISYAADPAENLSLLAQAESLCDGLPDVADPGSADRRRLCRVHYWMGRCHYYAGAYPAAFGYYRRVLEAARSLDDDELVALPSGALGRVILARGGFSASRDLLLRALDPLERTGQVNDWIVTVMFMGVLEAGNGRAAEAMGWCERGAARAREAKSPRDISISLTMRGVILSFLGRPREVVDSCRRAVESAVEGGDELYAYLGHGVGAWGHARLDEHAAAEEAMGRAEAIQRAMGRRLLFADWFEAIRVEMAARAARSSEAIARAAELIPAMKAGGTAFAEALVQRALGVALAAEGEARFVEAEAALAESTRIFEQGGIRVEAARAQRDLAGILRARGELESAEQLEAGAALVLRGLSVDAK